MSSVRPIETLYNGYRFRSRLEARWAVFFDAMGIKYEYEPEGFDVGDGVWYLPDFYLPDIDGGIYIEVKGVMDDESRDKIEKFADCGEAPLYVLGGIPTQAELDDDGIYEYVSRYEGCFQYYAKVIDEAKGETFSFSDWPYLFCVCPACGKVGLAFDGRGWRVCGNQHKDKDITTETYRDGKGRLHKFVHPEVAGWRTDDKGYSWNQRRLVDAYAKARQARFEHGETPRGRSVQGRA